MKIAENLMELIGNTPLVRLSNYSKKENLNTNLIAKVESFNPLSSVKDRAAYYMIMTAVSSGKINNDTIVIEPTSGNTGIGLAYCCTILGYKLILTMPETMSIERRQLLKALGAELVLTEGAKGMSGAIEKAEELAKEYKNSFIPSQFTNQANAQAHRETTAVEILNDTDKKVDVFVAGVGTGGTITGIGEVLKENIPGVKIVAVEPQSSPVLSKGEKGPHKIQGIGAGFVPELLNRDVIDEVITVTNEDAYATVKKLATTEGILVGISSGAAVYAASQLAKKEEYKDKNIIVLLPDTGERYMSTGVFE